jgi:hypothetical protein
MPHPGNVRIWMNPPTDTSPEREVLLELAPDKAHIAAEAFAAQAEAIEETDPKRARALRSLAHQFRHAVLTPEEADTKNISDLDTMHPANQLSRLLGTALTQLARWSGPVTLLVNAMDHAVAIAAARDGEKGIREVVSRARSKATSLEWTAFGRVGPIGDAPDAK